MFRPKKKKLNNAAAAAASASSSSNLLTASTSRHLRSSRIQPTLTVTGELPADHRRWRIIDDGLGFEQRHGKDRVRVARVWMAGGGRHFMVEWDVSVSLFSAIVGAYTLDDNSGIVATDTMKNTVYVKAKECSEQLSVEHFAILLAKHFTSFHKEVSTYLILGENIRRQFSHLCSGFYFVAGRRLPYLATVTGFRLGSEKHTTEVTVKKSGALELTSGIAGLSVLKTAMSGFEGFIRDKCTSLPETRQRMLATEVTATWRYSYDTLSCIPRDLLYFQERYKDAKEVLIYTFFGPPKEGVYSASLESTLYQMARAVLSGFPDISAVQLKMPNLHFSPVNMSTKDNPSMVKFDNDVYLPTDEPHGSIQVSLSRFCSRM